MRAGHIQQNGTDRTFLFHTFLTGLAIVWCRIVQKMARKGNSLSSLLKRQPMVAAGRWLERREDSSGWRWAWMPSAGCSARASRSAGANACCPAARHVACQHLPSGQTISVVSFPAHRAPWLWSASAPSRLAYPLLATIAESVAGLPRVGRSRRKPADYRRGEEPLGLPPGRKGSSGGGGVITPHLMSRQTKTPVSRSEPTTKKKKRRAWRALCLQCFISVPSGTLVCSDALQPNLCQACRLPHAFRRTGHSHVRGVCRCGGSGARSD